MSNEIREIKFFIQQSIDAKQKVLDDNSIAETVGKMAAQIVGCLKNGGKLLICGNGGSASDAIHIAVRLSDAFKKKEGRIVP